MKPRGSVARDFLSLFAGLEATLLLLAALVDVELTSPATHLILVATASSVATLGLFMTRGDPGSRIGNAAKTLFVLFVLVGSVVVLLSWAASTTGNGS